MAEKETLQLSFQPQTTWGYEILNSFSDEMHNSYRNGLARELMLSITQKMELFFHITPKLNHYAGEMKEVIRADSKQVEECLEKGFAYSGIEDELRVAFMSTLDAAIFECDSLCELVEKFCSEVKKNILGQDENFSLQNKAKEGSLDIQWRKNLRSIRNDWIHNYVGWLAFKKINEEFDIMIEIPSNVRKNFRNDNVNTFVVNTILNGVNDYLAFAQKILVEEIERAKNTEVMV